MLTRVVLAIDRPKLRKRFRGLLEGPDVLLESLAGKAGLWERMATRAADIYVVSDSSVPEPRTEALQFLRGLPDSPAVVVVSGSGDAREAADLVAAGCEAVLYEALEDEALREVVATILEKRAQVAQGLAASRREMTEARLSDFVSRSPAMQVFMRLVERVAPSDVSLLILGETGVGKERLARAIHAEGRRSDGPFVAINCGALPESLLESELFGHEKGAFTGAARTRRGLFELAHQGTIFLDEIGEMPLPLQVKLLRILQDHKVQPVGSEREIKVDVRVMAASNRALQEEVEAKQFRRDLFYRLSVVTLTIPPLRERREDIGELVESYISYLRPQVGSQVDGISKEAMEALCEYSWPGNVRELINIIERGMLLADGAKITLSDLPDFVRTAEPGPASGAPLFTAEDGLPDELLTKPLSEARREVLDRFERTYLTGLLQATNGHVGETAKRAGIQPRSLYDKMKRHGLCKEDFRPRKGSR